MCALHRRCASWGMYVRLCRTYGAVAALQGCTRAVSVARAVMEHSPHNVIVRTVCPHRQRLYMSTSDTYKG